MCESGNAWVCAASFRASCVSGTELVPVASGNVLALGKPTAEWSAAAFGGSRVSGMEYVVFVGKARSVLRGVLGSVCAACGLASGTNARGCAPEATLSGKISMSWIGDVGLEGFAPGKPAIGVLLALVVSGCENGKVTTIVELAWL